MNNNDFIPVFKALGDSTRLEIVQMLAGGEMCACKILEKFEITQPTLSHHMKLLCDADIVQGRKEGKWVHYSINPEGAERAEKMLAQLVTLDNSDKKKENSCGE